MPSHERPIVDSAGTEVSDEFLSLLSLISVRSAPEASWSTGQVAEDVARALGFAQNSAAPDVLAEIVEQGKRFWKKGVAAAVGLSEPDAAKPWWHDRVGISAVAGSLLRLRDRCDAVTSHGDEDATAWRWRDAGRESGPIRLDDIADKLRLSDDVLRLGQPMWDLPNEVGFILVLIQRMRLTLDDDEIVDLVHRSFGAKATSHSESSRVLDVRRELTGNGALTGSMRRSDSYVLADRYEMCGIAELRDLLVGVVPESFDEHQLEQAVPVGEMPAASYNNTVEPRPIPPESILREVSAVLKDSSVPLRSDEIAAELARRFGIPDRERDFVSPGYKNTLLSYQVWRYGLNPLKISGGVSQTAGRWRTTPSENTMIPHLQLHDAVQAFAVRRHQVVATEDREQTEVAATVFNLIGWREPKMTTGWNVDAFAYLILEHASEANENTGDKVRADAEAIKSYLRTKPQFANVGVSVSGHVLIPHALSDAQRTALASKWNVKGAAPVGIHPLLAAVAQSDDYQSQSNAAATASFDEACRAFAIGEHELVETESSLPAAVTGAGIDMLGWRKPFGKIAPAFAYRFVDDVSSLNERVGDEMREALQQVIEYLRAKPQFEGLNVMASGHVLVPQDLTDNTRNDLIDRWNPTGVPTTVTLRRVAWRAGRRKEDPTPAEDGPAASKLASQTSVSRPADSAVPRVPVATDLREPILRVLEVENSPLSEGEIDRRVHSSLGLSQAAWTYKVKPDQAYPKFIYEMRVARQILLESEEIEETSSGWCMSSGSAFPAVCRDYAIERHDLAQTEDRSTPAVAAAGFDLLGWRQPEAGKAVVAFAYLIVEDPAALTNNIGSQVRDGLAQASAYLKTKNEFKSAGGVSVNGHVLASGGDLTEEERQNTESAWSAPRTAPVTLHRVPVPPEKEALAETIVAVLREAEDREFQDLVLEGSVQARMAQTSGKLYRIDRGFYSTVLGGLVGEGVVKRTAGNHFRLIDAAASPSDVTMDVPGVEDKALKDELNDRVSRVERALREFIGTVLNDDPDKVLHHIQQKMQERIDKRLRKQPALDRAGLASLRGRLQYADLSELEAIILSDAVWDPAMFGTKPMVQFRFQQIRELRNVLRHDRDLTAIEQKDGDAGLEWFEEIFRQVALHAVQSIQEESAGGAIPDESATGDDSGSAGEGRPLPFLSPAKRRQALEEVLGEAEGPLPFRELLAKAGEWFGLSEEEQADTPQGRSIPVFESLMTQALNDLRKAGVAEQHAGRRWSLTSRKADEDPS